MPERNDALESPRFPVVRKSKRLDEALRLDNGAGKARLAAPGVWLQHPSDEVKARDVALWESDHRQTTNPNRSSQ
jgi:hypothetical protein